MDGVGGQGGVGLVEIEGGLGGEMELGRNKENTANDTACVTTS